MTRLRYFSSTALVLVALAYSSSAAAQSASDGPGTTTAPSQPAAKAANSIADIVVTAQKRSERLQDVPISIAAIGGSQLRARGIVTSNDIGHATTGLVIAETDSSVVPYIRGLGSDTNILGEVGSVATYLDDVYIPDSTAAVFNLVNIESVEVLKGPQGTLFGRNTSGGAIVIRTQAPKFTPDGSFEGSYGNYNQADFRGFLTGPLSDKVALSVTGNYHRIDGYIDDLYRGGKIGNAEEYGGRARLLVNATERLSISLIGDYSHNSDPSGVAESAINGYLGQTPTSLAPTGPYDYIGNLKPRQVAISSGVSGRIDYKFDTVTLSSITAYRHSRVDSDIEVDRTPIDYIELTTVSPYSVFSQEVQLTSNNSSHFSWVAGGYFAHQTAKYDPVFIFGSILPASLTERIYTYANVLAGYANGTYKLGDFELTGGLRVNRDQKSYQGSLDGVQVVSRDDAHKSWTSFTPRAILAYHPNRKFMLYGSYSQGFKSGNYNSTAFETTPVNPETVKAYEIGLKASPLPWLTMNGAVFLYNRKNVQVNAQDPVTGQGHVETAGSSRTKGAEIEVNMQPTRALSIHAGATYLDAHYVHFPNAQVFIPNPVGPGMLPGSLGNTGISADVAGQKVERSPDWTFNLAVSYKAELPGGGDVTPSLNLFRTSSFFFNRGSRLLQPAYTTLDGQIAWTLGSGKVTLAVWAKNLTDARYFRTYSASAFGDDALYAEPRTFGLRVTFRPFADRQ